MCEQLFVKRHNLRIWRFWNKARELHGGSDPIASQLVIVKKSQAGLLHQELRRLLVFSEGEQGGDRWFVVVLQKSGHFMVGTMRLQVGLQAGTISFDD